MIAPAWIKLKHGGGFQRPHMVIIHAMAEYISADQKTAQAYNVPAGSYHAFQWLDICKLSAHALITPNGAIIRPKSDDEIAWHARGYNTGSLGIEYLVPGTHDYGTFSKAMEGDYLPAPAYAAGIEQMLEWIDAYNINRIATHTELDPARKKDPGKGFPLQRLLDDIGPLA